LYNVLERIILLSRGDEIDEATVDYALVTEAQGQPIEALPAPVASRQELPVAESSRPVVRGHQAIAADDREQIQAALVQHGGNKSRTARALNLTLRQLNYRIEILGIAVPAKKSANL
jgi:Nif-specific regulatory protein